MSKKIKLGARVVIGLIYFVFGGMGLAIALGLMKMPDQPMPEGATAFMTGIMASGYFFPLLKITEALCGLLLLLNVAAPLMLIILAPVTLNIVLFNACLMPGAGSLILPAIMAFTHIVAMGGYWQLYRPLFGKHQAT